MRRLQPLLPALPRGEAQRGAEENGQSQRRIANTTACNSCRRKKIKCDGQRPACHRCTRRNSECIYETADGETHLGALKRKLDVAHEENKQLRELYSYLVSCPQQDVYEILRRMRATNDPIAILHDVKQAEILIPNPGPEHANKSPLSLLEAESLENSYIKAPARPWTMVAGDGIVSNLISSFFSNDHNYLVPFVHRGSFLKDMRSQSFQEARYCSPLLVNAICALKCLTSQRAKQMGRITNQVMAERFLSEAKKLLELEGTVANLTTVQALCLMYLTSALLGRDRAGLMYRYTAYEMLRPLRLERKFTLLNSDNPEDAQTRYILSRALWGFFCFEGRMAYFYSEPSLLHRPSIPNLFDERTELEEDTLLDISPDPSHSPEPGLFRTLCSLSEVFYDAMVATTTSASSNSNDSVSIAHDLFLRFKSWCSQLPENMLVEKKFTVQNCYLHLHISETAYSIMHLLPSHDLVRSEGLSLKELCVRYCQSDCDAIEQYMKQRRPDPLLGRGLFVSLSNLAPLLDDTALHSLFVRQCAMLRACLFITPLVRVLLKGVQATVWALKKSIPMQARPYFEGLNEESQSNQDLPIEFSIPHRDEMRRMLSGEAHENLDYLGVRLSDLASRWALLSVDFA